MKWFDKIVLIVGIVALSVAMWRSGQLQGQQEGATAECHAIYTVQVQSLQAQIEATMQRMDTINALLSAPTVIE